MLCAIIIFKKLRSICNGGAVMIKGKPFVKWAGGKRQIIDKLKEYAPLEFGTYYEPFVGGGAFLFELSPRIAVINDSNKELMNVYECIRDEDKFDKMCKELNYHEANHSEEYYYHLRNLERNKTILDLRGKRRQKKRF